MTDVPPSPPPPPIDPDKVARQRHFAIGLFRLSGAFIVPILPKLLPASQVPIGLPPQWLESCLP